MIALTSDSLSSRSIVFALIPSQRVPAGQRHVGVDGVELESPAS